MEEVEPPSDQLEEYSGPYPVEDLQAARRTLISSIRGARGPVWDTLKDKLGIPPSGRVQSRTYPDTWIPKDIPFSQWCGSLTLISGDTKMKNEEDSHLSQTIQSEDENVPLHLQAGSSTARFAVTQSETEFSGGRGGNTLGDNSCFQCGSVDCLCPLVLASCKFPEEDNNQHSDLRVLISHRKRKVARLSCNRDAGSQKVHVLDVEKEPYGVKVEGAPVIQKSGDVESGAVVRKIKTECLAKTVSSSESVKIRLTTNTDEAKSISASTLSASSVTAQTFALFKESSPPSHSHPTLKAKDAVIVAEDAYGNKIKRKVSAGIKVKEGKSFLQNKDLNSLGSLMYKCDYCKFVETSFEGLTAHLVKCQHPSGSQCFGLQKKEKDSCMPRCILRLSFVLHPPALYKTLVPVCPFCQTVHRSVESCVAHAYDVHGVTGAYSLRAVCYMKTILVSKKNKCSVCKQEFASYKELSMHWQSTKHASFKASGNGMVFFHCPYCPQTDSDFEACRRHVLHTHKQQGSPDGCEAVNAVFLGEPTPVRYLMLLVSLQNQDHETLAHISPEHSIVHHREIVEKLKDTFIITVKRRKAKKRRR